MNIKPIKSIDLKTAQFLTDNGSIFIHPKWLKIYTPSKVELNGIYNKGGDIIGAFVLYTDKKWKMNWIKTPPYSSNISLFFINPSKNNAKKITFEKKVLKAIISYLEKKNKSLTTLSFPVGLNDMQPFIWEEYKVIPNYTYRINLQNISEEDILKIASPEKRNEQKKAIKDGIQSKLSYDYSLTMDMVKHTFERKKQKLNSNLVSNILNNFSSPENSYSYVSFVGEKPIAATFVVHDTNTAYYLLGGYDPNNRHNGAGVMSLFNAIIEAKKRGLKTFDFEGSMLPEVEKYFRAFGAELTPYFTINKAIFPLEVLLKKSKRSRF